MALSDEPPDDEDLQALEGGDPEAEFGAIRAELDAMDADLREETVVVGRLHVDPMLVEHRKGDLLLWSIDPVIKNGKKDKYAGGFQNADIRIDTSTYGKGRVRVKRWARRAISPSARRGTTSTPHTDAPSSVMQGTVAAGPSTCWSAPDRSTPRADGRHGGG